jgi:hypothetical protein
MSLTIAVDRGGPLGKRAIEKRITAERLARPATGWLMTLASNRLGSDIAGHIVPVQMGATTRPLSRTGVPRCRPRLGKTAAVRRLRVLRRP